MLTQFFANEWWVIYTVVASFSHNIKYGTLAKMNNNVFIKVDNKLKSNVYNLNGLAIYNDTTNLRATVGTSIKIEINNN